MLRIEFCTSKETIGSCIIRANQSTTRRNNNRNNMRIVEIRMRQSTCQLLLNLINFGAIHFNDL